MAAKDDFFISFGSNASTFAAQIERDLQPAMTFVQALSTELAKVDGGVNKNVARLQQLLGQGGGGGGGGAGAPSTKAFDDAANAMARNLLDLNGQIQEMVGQIKLGNAHLNRSRAAYDRDDQSRGDGGRIAGAGQGKQPFYAMPLSPDMQRMLAQAASSNAKTREPSIREVTGVQINDASFDRVVRAVNQVRDEVRKLKTAPGRGEAEATRKRKKRDVEAPEAEVAPEAAAKGPKTSAAAKSAKKRTDDLVKSVSGLQVEINEIKAMAAQLGDLLPAEMQTALTGLETQLKDAKAELAAADRESSGIPRKEQRRRRREEFANRPDLEPEEYDRRTRVRSRLDLAMDPELFKQAIGKGEGQLRKSDLIEMAKELSALGFQTRSGKNQSADTLRDDIVRSRQDMYRQYGDQVPSQLQTGRRLMKDRVSDRVKDLLADINLGAEEAIREDQARQNVRDAYRYGHVPKDPTARPTGDRDRSGRSIGVPPGMVKGGEYNDVFDFMSSQELLRANSMRRAEGLVRRNPQFNPYDFNLREEVKGGGEEAEGAKRAFLSIRAALRELDDLGAEYDGLTRSIQEVDSFIERAQNRLDRALAGKKLSAEQQAKLATDPTNIELAMAKRAELADRLDSRRFGGNQDIFEDPEYQAGRREREMARAKADAAAEIARANRAPYVGDAAGFAMVNARLAPGTRDTFIRDIPGVRYDQKRGFRSTDPDSDPAAFQKANQAWQATQSAMYRRANLADEVDRGDRPQEDLDKLDRRIENKATQFLNELQRLTGGVRSATGEWTGGISRSIEDVIGRAPTRPKNIRAEEQRMAATQEARDLIDGPKPQGATDVQQLSRRVAVVDRAMMKAAAATEAVAESDARLKSAIAEREQTLDAQNSAAIAEARAALELAEAERKAAAEQTEFGTRQEPGAYNERQRVQTLSRQLDAEEKRLKEEFDKANPPSRAVALTGDAAQGALQKARADLEVAEKEALNAGRYAYVSSGAVVNAVRRQRGLDDAAQEARFNPAASARRLGVPESDLAGIFEGLQRAADAEVKRAVKASDTAGLYAEDTLERVDEARARVRVAQIDAEASGAQVGPAPELDSKEARRLRKELGEAADDYEAAQRARIEFREAEERNAQQMRVYREAAARETAARKRLTDLLGGESKDIEGLRVAHEQLRSAESEAAAAAKGAASDLRALAEGQATQRVESRRAQLREVDNAGGDAAIYAERVKNLEKAEFELSRITSMPDDALFAEMRAKGDKAGGVSEPASIEGRGVDASARKTSDSLAKLNREIERAEKVNRGLTDVRARIDKAKAAGEDTSSLTAEREALRASADRRSREQLKGLRAERTRLARSEEAGTPGGPSGPAGPRPPRPGGGGGFSDESNSILRDILTAINGIHRTLQTGVKTTGGAAKVTKVDENGQPVPTKPRASTSYMVAGRDEQAQLKAGKAGDQRQLALAAASQQRRLERTKESDIERAHTQALIENVRLENKAAAERKKSANITAAAAHEQLQLAHAYEQVDAHARQELATLKRLNSENADATDIAQQQARAVAAVERSLGADGQGFNATSRKQMGRALVNDQGGTPLNAESYQQANRSAHAMFGPRLATTMEQAGQDGRDALATALFGNAGFWSRIMGSTGAFIVRNFTAGFVFGMTAALQDVVYQGIITESTWIRVSDALEQTGRSAGSLRSDLQSISSDYGVALNDVYMTAAGLAGVFENVGDISSATRVVAELQQISMGALTASEAMGVLASITGAYREQLDAGADGLTHVADVLTVVQNTIGTNVEVTSEGVGALSGLANQLRIDFEDMSVYVGQIAKLTNQTGAAAGEQFSRILASMQSGRGRAALAEALPSSGIEELLGSGEYGQAIQVLMREWDGLSETQQRNLSVTIAGQRQARAFAALMADTGKTLDATARAHDANGEAAARAERIAATLNGQIARLQSNLQNLAQNLIRTGILNFFGVLLKVANGLLTLINSFFSTVNDFTDNDPFLDMLKNWGVGILGFILTMKLAGAAFRGFRASMAELRAGEGPMAAGVNAAMGGAGAAAGQPERKTGVRGFLINSPAAVEGRFLARRDDQEARAAAASQAATAASGKRAAALNREAAMATRQAAIASRAASATQRVGAGMAMLGGMGLGATAALAGVTAGVMLLTSELMKQAEYHKKLKELNESQGYTSDGKRDTPENNAYKYVGPYDEARREEEDRRGGFGAGFVQSFKEFYSAPFNGTLLDGPDEMKNNRDQWKRGFDEEVQSSLDAANAEIEAILSSLDGGMSLLESSDNSLEALGNLKNLKAPTNFNESDVLKMGENAREVVTQQRSDLLKQFKDEEIGDQEYAFGMAQLEEADTIINDAIARQIMMAKGFASQDSLSSDMLKQIDQIRPLLQQIQGQGLDADMLKMMDTLVEDTGVPTDSKAGKIMASLAEGNLSKVEAMQKDRDLIDAELTNAQAKYEAATSGDIAMEPEDLDELESQIIGYIQQLASKTDEIIAGFVAQSTAIANAAIAAGDYTEAQAAIQAGLAGIGEERRLAGPESPEIAATRDLQESQLSQQGAEAAAQEKNTRLQMSQARSQSSERDAALEARITQNTYKALMAAQRAAQANGQQGPPVEAIRAAKMAWIQAEQSLAGMAQQANIAAMAANVASMWNGTAIAQGNEAIALQQLNDAISNFGEGSVEHLNALAGYSSAQQNTVTTMDQVAQATNDAALAAIPQGNAVAVANQGVRNAQAALAAAEKYGTNSVEYQNALGQLASAQQSASQATMAIAEAQVQVSIAVANAAGNTVAAAALQLRAARIAFANARARAGGAMSTEALQAKASVISAQAALRDARLQDDLDTIDFNLEMGKMTQASAIRALQEILRTRELTKQQRRDLMLQIKGMEEEMSEGPWNFGDIKLPKPYLMKRYIAEMREANTARASAAVNDAIGPKDLLLGLATPNGSNPNYSTTVQNEVTISINGGNVAEIRRVVEEVVGKPTKTRTMAPRRGRR